MHDWTRVRREHVTAAIAECDRLGSREFQQRYRFGHTAAHSIWSGGQEYDIASVVGVAYLRATGDVVPGRDVVDEMESAARVLSNLGFEVAVDQEELAALTLARKAAPPPPPEPDPAPASAPRAAATPRKAAAPRKVAAAKPPVRKTIKKVGRPTTEPEATICPTCFMALPATGICDNCD